MPPKIPEEDILDDLRRLADELGKPPSLNDYAKDGEYGTGTLQRRFGGIKNARKAAGLGTGPTRPRKPTEEELLDELRRLDAEHDGPVTYNLTSEHGEWTPVTYDKRFGSFSQAREEADLDGPDKAVKASRTELIEAIHELHDDLGKVPTRDEMEQSNLFSKRPFQTEFGSWADAVRAAGFEPWPQGGLEAERNPNWNPDQNYDVYKDVRWYRNRPKALERDGHQCVVCGMTNEEHREQFPYGLHVHHKLPTWLVDDDDSSIHALDNLVTLCRPHHRLFEGMFLGPWEIVEKR